MKRINVQVLTVFIMAASTCYGQQDTSKIRKAEASYRTGKDYLKEKKTDAAISSFTESIALHPTDSAYANLGFAYLQKRDDKNALFSLNKAIDLNAGYAWALGLRGYLYAKLNKNEPAMVDFTSAIALDPQSSGALSGRGAFYIASGKPDLAIADITKEIEIDPEAVNNYYNRASTYGNRAPAYKYQKNYRAAIKDYTTMITLDPKDLSAYKARGEIHRLLGKKKAAAADFKKAEGSF